MVSAGVNLGRAVGVVVLVVLLVGNVVSSPIIGTGIPRCPVPSGTYVSTPAPQKQSEFLAQITLYTGNDHTGVSHKLMFKSESCQNLPEYLWNRTKSVNSHETCVQLCSSKDCSGHCIKFFPKSPNHNNLRQLGFHKRAKSAIPCVAPN